MSVLVTRLLCDNVDVGSLLQRFGRLQRASSESPHLALPFMLDAADQKFTIASENGCAGILQVWSQLLISICKGSKTCVRDAVASVGDQDDDCQDDDQERILRMAAAANAPQVFSLLSKIAEQMIGALVKLHRSRICHGAVTVSNVQVSKSGNIVLCNGGHQYLIGAETSACADVRGVGLVMVGLVRGVFGPGDDGASCVLAARDRFASFVRSCASIPGMSADAIAAHPFLSLREQGTNCTIADRDCAVLDDFVLGVAKSGRTLQSIVDSRIAETDDAAESPSWSILGLPRTLGRNKQAALIPSARRPAICSKQCLMLSPKDLAGSQDAREEHQPAVEVGGGIEDDAAKEFLESGAGFIAAYLMKTGEKHLKRPSKNAKPELLEIAAAAEIKDPASSPDLNPTFEPQVEEFSSALTTLIKDRELQLSGSSDALRSFVALCNDLARSRGNGEGGVLGLPPSLRPIAWCCILGIEVRGNLASPLVAPPSCRQRYDFLLSRYHLPHPMDRQLDQDIPRCHQYHPMLRSAPMRASLRRVLKAWMLANPQLVYWQGLDSVCAPLLALFRGNEALTFAALDRLVSRCLRGLFTLDNTAVLRRKLRALRQMLAFHDPEVASHLQDLDVTPDLFAIPWTLTMFAHVFPIEYIWRLWDVVLSDERHSRSGESYLVMFSVSILILVRSTLLAAKEFSDIVGFLTRLPLRVEMLVTEGIDMAHRACSLTPDFFGFADPPAQYPDPLSAPSTPTQTPLPAGAKLPKPSPYTEFPGRARPGRVFPVSHISPELCAQDLVALLQDGSAIVADVRPRDDFDASRIRGSKHFTLPSDPGALAQLHRDRATVVVVVDDDGEGDAVTFANDLVRNHVHYVCTLRGGMPAFEALERRKIKDFIVYV